MALTRLPEIEKFGAKRAAPRIVEAFHVFSWLGVHEAVSAFLFNVEAEDDKV